MTAALFTVLAIAMLVLTGWWIGRQFLAHETSGQPLSIVLQVSGKQWSAAERELRIAFADLAPGKDIEILSHQTSPDPSAILVSADALGSQSTVRIVPSSLHPLSFALQDLQSSQPVDWDRVARRVLLHVDQPRAQASDHYEHAPFERMYIAIWRDMHNPQRLHEAHQGLRDAIAAWPPERDDEKAVTLANLAALCLRLEEPATTHLARRLEGLDAADEALRLAYRNVTAPTITGLRTLRRELAKAVDTAPDNLKSREFAAPHQFSTGFEVEADGRVMPHP